MSRLWENILNAFNYIGDHSGCHQIPERCFTVKGYTFPVCARCTGVYVGQTIAVVMLLFRYVAHPLVAVGCLGIMGLDWSVQYLKIKSSTNLRRFITGILGGYGFFTMCFIAVNSIIKIMKNFL